MKKMNWKKKSLYRHLSKQKAWQAIKVTEEIKIVRKNPKGLSTGKEIKFNNQTKQKGLSTENLSMYVKVYIFTQMNMSEKVSIMIGSILI